MLHLREIFFDGPCPLLLRKSGHCLSFAWLLLSLILESVTRSLTRSGHREGFVLTFRKKRGNTVGLFELWSLLFLAGYLLTGLLEGEL